jgi:hypothetical protein
MPVEIPFHVREAVEATVSIDVIYSGTTTVMMTQTNHYAASIAGIPLGTISDAPHTLGKYRVRGADATTADRDHLFDSREEAAEHLFRKWLHHRAR